MKSKTKFLNFKFLQKNKQPEIDKEIFKGVASGFAGSLFLLITVLFLQFSNQMKTEPLGGFVEQFIWFVVFYTVLSVACLVLIFARPIYLLFEREYFKAIIFLSILLITFLFFLFVFSFINVLLTLT